MPEDQTTPDVSLDAPPSGEVAPSGPLDVDELLLSGLIQVPDEGIEPVVDEAEVVPDGPVDEATESDETEDEEPEAAVEQTEDQQMQGYLQMVSQAPQRINEVPGKLRGRVFQEFAALMYQAGQNVAAQQITAREQQLSQIRQFVAEKEQVEQEDPDAFLAWQRENPDQAAAYWQARRVLESGGQQQTAPPQFAPQPPQQQAGADPNAIQQEANREFTRVSALPENVRQSLLQRVEGGEFPLTREGLAALRSAIATAEQLAGSTNGTAEKRQAAAARRKETARAEVDAGGSPPTEPNPIQHITEVSELLAAGVD